MQTFTLGYLTLNAPPATVIDAAAATDFRSVGIRITGRRVAEPYTPVLGRPEVIRDLRHRLADAGLKLSNVTAYHLFPDVTLDHMKAVVDATAELGASILLAHSYVPVEGPMLDLFRAYAAHAERAGIRIACEFMRYSEVPTLEATTRWLELAGAPNAGYLIDPLHLDRSGGRAEDIARIDASRIVFVQICDAKHRQGTPTRDELREEARNERLAPGDGDLPLYAFLDALPREIEIEYEVPRPADAGLPPAEVAMRASHDFHRFIAGYAKARGRDDPWPRGARASGA